MSDKTHADELIEAYTSGERSIEEVVDAVTVIEPLSVSRAFRRLLVPTVIRSREDEKRQDRFWRERETAST